MLKRTDLNAGGGVVVVSSAADLAARRAAEPWSGRPILLQALFERFLRPLRFDGAANIDFKRRADGSIVVAEIHPRLGGSRMRPEFRADLVGALRAILAHAKWHTEPWRRYGSPPGCFGTHP